MPGCPDSAMLSRCLAFMIVTCVQMPGCPDGAMLSRCLAVLMLPCVQMPGCSNECLHIMWVYPSALTIPVKVAECGVVYNIYIFLCDQYCTYLETSL
jgi:hypothetical protein